jgi:hypothetical protein
MPVLVATRSSSTGELVGCCAAAPDTLIRFACTRPAHLANAIPGVMGSLVTLHGTCGYCAGQAGDHHEWVATGGVALASLLRPPTGSRAPSQEARGRNR